MTEDDPTNVGENDTSREDAAEDLGREALEAAGSTLHADIPSHLDEAFEKGEEAESDDIDQELAEKIRKATSGLKQMLENAGALPQASREHAISLLDTQIREIIKSLRQEHESINPLIAEVLAPMLHTFSLALSGERVGKDNRTILLELSPVSSDGYSVELEGNTKLLSSEVTSKLDDQIKVLIGSSDSSGTTSTSKTFGDDSQDWEQRTFSTNLGDGILLSIERKDEEKDGIHSYTTVRYVLVTR